MLSRLPPGLQAFEDALRDLPDLALSSECNEAMLSAHCLSVYGHKKGWSRVRLEFAFEQCQPYECAVSTAKPPCPPYACVVSSMDACPSKQPNSGLQHCTQPPTQPCSLVHALSCTAAVQQATCEECSRMAFHSLTCSS